MSLDQPLLGDTSKLFLKISVIMTLRGEGVKGHHANFSMNYSSGRFCCIKVYELARY